MVYFIENPTRTELCGSTLATQSDRHARSAACVHSEENILARACERYMTVGSWTLYVAGNRFGFHQLAILCSTEINASLASRDIRAACIRTSPGSCGSNPRQLTCASPYWTYNTEHKAEQGRERFLAPSLARN